MPLYPYLLALFYALGERNLLVACFLQLTLGSVNCLLVYRLGKCLKGTPLGLLAAFFLALSGVSIFYEAMLVPTVAISFLLLSTLLVLLEAEGIVRWGLGGILWGLTALTHAAILLWSPFVGAWGLWRRSQAVSKKWLSLGSCFLALCSVLTLSGLRNYWVGREFVLLTAHGGVNFFIGNNPEATGQFKSHFSRYTSAEQLFQQSKKAAEKEAGHPLTDGESSRFWFRKGLEFIRRDPEAFLKLLGRKWSLFWNAYEIPDVEDFYSFRQEFPVLKFAPFQSALLCPLALLGILLSLREPKRFFLVHGILFSMIGGLLLFFVNSRYRASLLPFLALFAAYGLLSLVDFVRRRRPRALLISLFVLFHLALWTRVEGFADDQGIGHYNAGIAYTQAGLFDRAIRELQKALLTSRDEGMIYFALGNAYFGQGKYEKAAGFYQEALSRHPDFSDAYFNLGVSYGKLNRFEEAKRALLEALRLDPNGADIRRQLKELEEKRL